MKTALVLAAVLMPALARAEVPHDADELTYRVDLYWDRKGPPEHTEKTERASEVMLNTEYRDALLHLQPGEHRWIYGTMVNGMECDHFGCAPAHRYSERIELVSVTSHHADLDGLRIAAHPLRVVDGAVSALLPGDQAWTLLEVRRDGERVAIDVTYEPGTRRATLVFALSELRARLADARAVAALAHGDRRVAADWLEGAIALDPDLDDAYLHRALVRSGGEADADVAIVAERSPVWLAWRLRSDKLFAPLRALPAARALEARGDAIDVSFFDETGLNLLADPSGRFLAVQASPTYVGESMRIVDRESGKIVAAIPIGCTDPKAPMSSAGDPERCRAKSLGAQVLALLGFARAESVSVRPEGEVQRRLDAAVAARETLDVQIERIGDLEIRRWIHRYPRWSWLEIVDLRPQVAVTPAHVEAAAPVEPPPAHVEPARVDPAPAPLAPRRTHYGWLPPLLLLGLAAALARPPQLLTRRG